MRYVAIVSSRYYGRLGMVLDLVAEFVMGRVCQGPSLSWAEFVMGRDVPESRNQLNLSIFDTPRQITVKSSKQSRSW